METMKSVTIATEKKASPKENAVPKAVGEVVAIAHAGSVEPGDRVVVMPQYLVKQDWLLLPIPDDMANEHGSLVCCGIGPDGLGGIINGVSRGTISCFSWT